MHITEDDPVMVRLEQAPVESPPKVIQRLRRAMDELPADAATDHRGQLHLELGIALSVVDREHLNEAAEELRQALDLLPEETSPLAHAITRYRLGRALTAQSESHAGAALLGEGEFHLERAHALLDRIGQNTERVEAARAWAEALTLLDRPEEARNLLERECERTKGAARSRVEFTLASFYLIDPRTQSRGEAILSAHLRREEPLSEEVLREIAGFLGAHMSRLSIGLLRDALPHFEAWTDAPIDLIVTLRSCALPDQADAWIKPKERDRLAARIDDPEATIDDRCRAAYTLITVLQTGERPLRLRAAQALEGWLDHLAIHPAQRAVYQHDLGVALRVLGEDDPHLIDSAVRHLEACLEALPLDRRTARASLADALLDAMEQRAMVSSPERAAEAERVEAIAAELPSHKARELRLNAAALLLQPDILAHPACVEVAGRLIARALEHEEDDPRACRMSYTQASILHEQGRGAAGEVARRKARAERRAGPIEPFSWTPKDVDPQAFRALARALSGAQGFSGVDLSLLPTAVVIRPDAADLLLDEVERRMKRPDLRDEERGALLEHAAKALAMPIPGDHEARARRMVALVVASAPRLSRALLRDLTDTLRGPLGTALTAALQGVGIDVSTPDDAQPMELPDAITKLHKRGVHLMEDGLKARDKRRKIELLKQARSNFERASAVARTGEPLHRAMVQISAGNVRRHLAKLDERRCRDLLDEAEALYREALPWTEGHSALQAQLFKVLADCLCQQGDGARWDEAMRLYNAALGVRSGGFTRAETLLSVADAELARPGRTRALCLGASLRRLEEALACASRYRLQIGERMTNELAELASLDLVTLDELGRTAQIVASACPELAAEARLAVFGLSANPIGRPATYPGGGLSPDIEQILKSKFVQAVAEATKAVSTPFLARNPSMRLPAEVRARIEQSSIDIRDDPSALRAEADRLAQVAETQRGERRAGYLLGRARVLAWLLALGYAALDELETAITQAQAAIRALPSRTDQAFGLMELATSLQRSGEGADFARSATMLEEALNTCPEGMVQLRLDAMQYHARATRYRQDMPRSVTIGLAIREYREVARGYRQLGMTLGFLATLRNLAEATGERQDIPFAQAWHASSVIEREAIAIARAAGGGEILGGLLGNLAWTLTRLARETAMPEAERRRYLDEAGELFAEAERFVADPFELEGLRNNKLNWEGIAGRLADRAKAVTRWREELARYNNSTQPQRWSMAAHNLAEQLATGSPEEVREAVQLYRRALGLRLPERGARHHWETAHALGMLLAGLRPDALPLNLTSLGLSPAMACAEATSALRSAMDAARSQGSGEQLAWSAVVLGRLAAKPLVTGEPPDLALADEAMSAFNEVLGVAPDEAWIAESEATVARCVAGALAEHRASTASGGSDTVGAEAVLDGGAAWEVMHWMLRARGGQHRRLRARMRKPEGVAAETWTRFRVALRGQKNEAERRQAAAAVRSERPDFLSGAPELSATITWMREAGGAAATLLETSSGHLLGVITLESGKPRARVFLLGGAPFGMGLPEVMDRFASWTRATGQHEQTARLKMARQTLDALGRWLCAAVIPVLRASLPASTGALLWSPHEVTAAAPLGLFWSDAPPTWTTPCITLPPPAAASLRASSALLVMADPEPTGSPRGIRGGPEAIAEIARSLNREVPRIEVLMGRGPERGDQVAVGLDVPGLLPALFPTSGEVRRRLGEHSLALVLAHSNYDVDQPEKSAMALLDDHGNVTELRAGELAETPDLLKGAVLVLLSCEAGAAGRLSAAPSGFAGVLIAVGASAVVAPLWPVRVSVALRIGRGIAGALAGGADLASAIHASVRQCLADLAGDARLGHPFERGPFVVWTG